MKSEACFQRKLVEFQGLTPRIWDKSKLFKVNLLIKLGHRNAERIGVAINLYDPFRKVTFQIALRGNIKLLENSEQMGCIL